MCSSVIDCGSVCEDRIRVVREYLIYKNEKENWGRLNPAVKKRLNPAISKRRRWRFYKITVGLERSRVR